MEHQYFNVILGLRARMGLHETLLPTFSSQYESVDFEGHSLDAQLESANFTPGTIAAQGNREDGNDAPASKQLSTA